MKLDLESIELAVSALKRSIEVSRRNEAAADLRETIRAGVIQHFEVAYERCWKFIQRWLRENRGPEEADFLRNRKELFRMAAQQGLISDPAPWFGFEESRSLTAHTYDITKAGSAYDAALRFIQFARELLDRLRERND